MADELQKAAESAQAAGGAGGVAALVTASIGALAAGVATVLKALGASTKVKALAETVAKLEGRVDEHDGQIDAMRGAVAAAATTRVPTLSPRARDRVPPVVDRRLDALEAWRDRKDREDREEAAATAMRVERLTGLVEGLTNLIRGGMR